MEGHQKDCDSEIPHPGRTRPGDQRKHRLRQKGGSNSVSIRIAEGALGMLSRLTATRAPSTTNARVSCPAVNPTVVAASICRTTRTAKTKREIRRRKAVQPPPDAGSRRAGMWGEPIHHDGGEQDDVRHHVSVADHRSGGSLAPRRPQTIVASNSREKAINRSGRGRGSRVEWSRMERTMMTTLTTRRTRPRFRTGERLREAGQDMSRDDWK